jgi:hypothetical protein
MRLQSKKPALQEARKQLPAEQAADACGNAQIVPQVPQLLGSNEVLVHMPPQVVSLLAQLAVQTPETQA